MITMDKYQEILKRRMRSIKEDETNQSKHFKELYKDYIFLISLINNLFDHNERLCSTFLEYERYFTFGGLIAKPLVIAGVEYQLIFSDAPSKEILPEGRTARGVCDWDYKYINIDRFLSEQLIYGCLIHEIIHALLFEIGEKELGENERFVYKVSSAIYQVIKSNSLEAILSGAIKQVNILGIEYQIKSSNDPSSTINFVRHSLITINEELTGDQYSLEVLNNIISALFHSVGESVEVKYTKEAIGLNRNFIKSFSEALYRTIKDNTLISPNWLKNLLPENTPIKVGYTMEERNKIFEMAFWSNPNIAKGMENSLVEKINANNCSKN